VTETDGTPGKVIYLGASHRRRPACPRREVGQLTITSDPLTDELARHGNQVHEALAVSEVFSMVEQHPTRLSLLQPMSIRNGPERSGGIRPLLSVARNPDRETVQ
jgi:hypothetical protein